MKYHSSAIHKFLSTNHVVFALLAAASAAEMAVAGPTGDPKPSGHVTAQAFADRAAVAPGEPLRLAVTLKMDKGWYIYWQNPGPIGGLPTEIEWTVPPGYQLGGTQYPVPHLKYDKILKDDANIYPGEATFVTSVRAPDLLAAGKEAVFKVKAKWLVCEKSCIPGEVELSLALPVIAKGETVKPANEKLFERAKDALPIPAARAAHLKLGGTIDKAAVSPGDKFTATVTAEVEAKHHMQSSKPLEEGLIPAVVFVEQTDGFEVGAVKYPEAQIRQDRLLGKMSEYSGQIAFKIPVTVADDADKSPRWIHGVLQSQICNDAGTCYPPQYVAFAIPVQMIGGEKPRDADAFVMPAEKPETAAAGTPSTEAVTELKENEKSAEREPPAEKAGSEEATAVRSAKPLTSQASAPAASRSANNLLIRFQEKLLRLGYFGAILLAFLGGFLMNLMPCVLPVISLKVLSFVRQAHDHRWRIFRLGLTYSAGIMIFYLVLSGLMYYGGIGWGQLFQNSVFVLAMAAIVLALALSLFGVFTILTPRVVDKLEQKAESREGYLSAFVTGLLATLLGTACTAPLLSVAIAYASRQPAVQGSLIFIAAGFGMALPVIVLTYDPAWLRFVPKAGPWMLTFEQIMGFILLATVIWLLNPLRGQIGDYGLLLSLIFLLAVAMAAWVKGRIEFGAPRARKAKLYGTMAVILLFGWMLPFQWMTSLAELTRQNAAEDAAIVTCARLRSGQQLDWSKGIPWQAYASDLVIQDVAKGFTVFVDYTAAWCASCKANKTSSLEVQQTFEVMRKLNVIPYEADYTSRNSQITADLRRFGRAGVPMYLVYKPRDPKNPEVLPELLTPSIVIEALQRAGPSRPTLPTPP